MATRHRGAGLSIGPQSSLVVFLGKHPHVVAAELNRQITKSIGESRTDASLSIALIDGQLVQEHLGSLVRMSHLDAAHESDRPAVRVRDEQVMVWVGEEASNRVALWRLVEQMGRLQDKTFVAGSEVSDVYVRRPG